MLPLSVIPGAFGRGAGAGTATGAVAGRKGHGCGLTERASPRAFFGLCALLFAASAAATIAWCAAMPEVCATPMPGGWSLSMAWRRLPGQTWPGAAASFTGMWLVMMVAMMLPSLAPRLWRYRQALGAAGRPRAAWPTALAGAGYFFVWTAIGIAVFPIGAALAQAATQLPEVARAAPLAVGMVVMGAGMLQFTAWKARLLAGCRMEPGHRTTLSTNTGAAWRHGLRLGLHCGYCCAGMTAVLLVAGVMDLRVMAAVMAAITLERLAPAGGRVARGIGAVAIAAGLFLLVRAAAELF